MQILGQSTKASPRLPYVHLGYLAANNGTGSLLRASSATSLLALIILFLVLSISDKKRRIFFVVIFILLSVGLIAGLTIQVDRYYPSYAIGSATYSVRAYADQNDGKLPDAETWCDQVIRIMMVSYDYEDNEVLPGECAFALNTHVAGKKLSELAPDTVLIFETEKGIDEQGRIISVREKFERDLNRVLTDVEFNKLKLAMAKYYETEAKIYPDRWNQSGGPEIATCKYNGGKGCDVAFVSGRTAFVPKDKLSKLNWGQD